MALEVAELLATLKADISNFESGMKKAQQNVKDVEAQAKTTSDNVSSAFKAVAGAVSAAGIVEAVRSIIDVTQEEATTHARLVTTLQDVTGATKEVIGAADDWVTKQAEAAGFTKGQMTDALNTAVLATHNLADSQKIVTEAEDVARAKGIDLTTATNLLAKATEGNTTQLVRQFPELQALKAGHASAADMVNYLTNSVKGQADAFANSGAGQMARFKVSLQELEVSIGNVLIPVLGKLASGASDVIGFFQKHEQVAVVLAGVIGGPLTAAMVIYAAQKTIAFGEDVIGVITKTASTITSFLIPSIEGATAAEEGFGGMEAIVTGGLSLLAGGAALAAFHMLATKAAATDTTGALQDTNSATQDLTSSATNAAQALDTMHNQFLSVVSAQQSYDASLRSIKTAQSDLGDAQAKLNTLLETHGVDVKTVTAATKTYDDAINSATKAQQDLDGAVQKLNDDMKPATVEQLTAAQDRLKTSTLDLQDATKSLADAIKHRDEVAQALASGTSLDPASTDDLTIAQGAANDAYTAWQASLSDSKSTVVDVAKAHKTYTDALTALTTLQKQGTVTADDLATANEDVQRKTIGVDGATTTLHDSQAGLNTVMQQGTDLDPTIIADRQTIADKTAALNTATANVASSQQAWNAALAGDPMLNVDVAGLRKDVADKTQALSDAQDHAATAALSLSGNMGTLQQAISDGKANRDDVLSWINNVASNSPGAAGGLAGIIGSIKGLNIAPPAAPTPTGQVYPSNFMGPIPPGNFQALPLGMSGPPSPRALGGPVLAGGNYLVGERGPELFSPSHSGMITPNGAGGGVTIVVNVAGSVATVGQLADEIHNALLAKQRRVGALGFEGA